FDGRERRLDLRVPAIAFERAEQTGLFSADISAGSTVRLNVKVIPGTIDILAEMFGFVSFAAGFGQVIEDFDELAANVNVSVLDSADVAGDQAALDDHMRIVEADDAIFAGTRL